MFLRKLVVMAAPLGMLLFACLLLPCLNGLGFWSNVLKGCAMGLLLGLLLPLCGAEKNRAPFATLLWVPCALTFGVVLCQYLCASGVSVPVLEALATTDGQVVLCECAFAGYMLAACLRIRMPVRPKARTRKKT